MPDSIARQALNKPELLLAQAFSMLKTGMPLTPIAFSAHWPRIEFCFSIWPWRTWENQAACMSSRLWPLSASALLTACSVSCDDGEIRRRPSGVWAMPVM